MVKGCPCNNCPYDCDENECNRYRVWCTATSIKILRQDFSKLHRKYKTAQRRITKLKASIEELRKENTKLCKIIDKYCQTIGELN